jgi:3-hydroxyisobutyryl-CoA hydrolase
MHFALPTESEIGEVVRGDHPTSGSFVVTFEEVIGRFEAMKEGKQGVRPKISEVVARRCDVDQLSGALKWKY